MCVAFADYCVILEPNKRDRNINRPYVLYMHYVSKCSTAYRYLSRSTKCLVMVAAWLRVCGHIPHKSLCHVYFLNIYHCRSILEVHCYTGGQLLFYHNF